MSEKVDARGLSCPQPVIMTLNAVKKGFDKELEIVVDTKTSMENVSRALQSKGLKVKEVLEDGELFTIKASKE
ncbi:MAG: sulfurtransferase TusA family protein [Desulforegulaceae bacterium]|nr:sulfurtransferase TusA family protein [Desulforegulaceae bacterium]